MGDVAGVVGALLLTEKGRSNFDVPTGDTSRLDDMLSILRGSRRGAEAPVGLTRVESECEMETRKVNLRWRDHEVKMRVEGLEEGHHTRFGLMASSEHWHIFQ